MFIPSQKISKSFKYKECYNGLWNHRMMNCWCKNYVKLLKKLSIMEKCM